MPLRRENVVKYLVNNLGPRTMRHLKLLYYITIDLQQNFNYSRNAYKKNKKTVLIINNFTDFVR